MSSAVDNPSSDVEGTGRRRNDAQASRRALLDAAGSLFDERGYQGATVRDIGERAGVDPALIARYFGGKEGLYLAVLEDVDPAPGSDDPSAVFARLLDRSETDSASNPICLAMVSPALGDGLREQLRAVIARRLIDPLSPRLAAAGVDRPRLRAELLVAVAIGVTLTRAGGTLTALSAASLDELHEVLDPLVARLAVEDS
ncbi:MAG TPA: TetR family transcriptional regulator [Baekduia sp.]|nr:TetR family transcriptional regulator [Baekduia sp.]